MEPPAKTTSGPNPLLAHLNDQDESHASTRVDFLHPGTVVQPTVAEAKTKAPGTPTPPPAPVVPVEPPKAPPKPTPAPPAPKSPHNRRPWLIAFVVILILALLGGGGYYYWKVWRPNHQSTPAQTNAPAPTVQVATPTSLDQVDSAGKSITTGGSLKPPLALKVNLTTAATSGNLQAQVEIQPVGTAFTGTPNYNSDQTSPSGGSLAAQVNISGLKDGQYHWQARLSDGTNNSSWLAFGSNAETTADFVIDSTAPAAAHLGTVGGKAVSGSSVSTTNNQPSFSGTAEAGAVVAVAISPDNQTGQATTDASGNWTINLGQTLANGDHTVTITTTDAAGNATTSTLTLSINTATAAPATTQIAPTGDYTIGLTMVGIALVALAAAGLILVLQYAPAKV